MKNSVSHPYTIKSLQAQATQLLPLLTIRLSELNYYDIGHQRIGQHNNDNLSGHSGLTSAQHPQFGHVMIKWQLSASGHDTDVSSLTHEIKVLAALENQQYHKNDSVPVFTITPPVLAHESMQVSLYCQNQQLTLFVMPYYKQGSLARHIVYKDTKPLTFNQKYNLIEQSAHLIAVLHHSGWLHGDIKPSNILLSNDSDRTLPTLLLTDFALAQQFNEKTDRYSMINIAGTPAYLAPECWQGWIKSHQSDIYAFGVLMYEILVGNRPFAIKPDSSDSLKDWSIQHCQSAIPILPIEHQHYQPLIHRILAKKKDKRYGSMKEVIRDLNGIA